MSTPGELATTGCSEMMTRRGEICDPAFGMFGSMASAATRKKLAEGRMAVTPEQMRDVIEEHLPYEISNAQLLLSSLMCRAECFGYRYPSENVLNASFCIYARNLIDFFAEEGVSARDYAGAKHYVGRSWVAFDGQQVKREPSRRHAMRLHIPDRTDEKKDQTDKVGAVEMDRREAAFRCRVEKVRRRAASQMARDLGCVSGQDGVCTTRPPTPAAMTSRTPPWRPRLRVPLALVVFVSATSKKSMVSEVNRRCSEYTLDGCRYFSSAKDGCRTGCSPMADWSL